MKNCIICVVTLNVLYCEWWRKSDGLICGWELVNHSLIYKIVVVKIMIIYFVLELLILIYGKILIHMLFAGTYWMKSWLLDFNSIFYLCKSVYISDYVIDATFKSLTLVCLLIEKWVEFTQFCLKMTHINCLNLTLFIFI